MNRIYWTTAISFSLFAQMAYSGTVGPKATESPSFEVGGRALYLQPSLNELRLANARTIRLVDGSTASFQNRLDYTWGFFIEGAYHYASNNDVNLNWYHINNQYNRSFTNLTGITSSVNVEPSWDAANLEFGKRIHLDEMNSARMHAGVQYARVKSNLSLVNAANSITGAVLTPTSTIQGNPVYNGFGPRFGIDFSRTLYQSLNVYANGAAAILAGTSKYEKRFTFAAGTADIYDASTMFIVPEVDAKLGVNYMYTVNTKYEFTFDAGWMFVNYWSPLNAIDIESIAATTTTDVGFQGPYVGLKLKLM